MKKSLSIATAAAVAGYRSKSSGTGCSTIDTSGTLDVFGDGSSIYFNNFENNGSSESSKFGTKSFKAFGSYINTGISESVNQTISLWYNITTAGYGADGICGILGDHNGGGGINIQAVDGVNFSVGVYTTSGWLGSSIPVVKNVWNNIIIITGTNSNQIYINGILAASNTGSFVSNSNVFLLGTSYSGYNFGRSFGGYIDQVRIFNRALTVAEVNTLYNEKKVPSVLKTYTETEMENVPVNNTTKANVELISTTNCNQWNINAFNTITPVAGDPIYLINGSVIIKVNEPSMMYSIFTDSDSVSYWHKYNILMSSDNGSTFNIPIDSYDVGTSQNIWYKSSTILQPGYYKIISGTNTWRCDNAWFFKKANYTSVIDTCDPYWSKTSLLLSGDGTNGAQNNTFNYKSSTYTDVVSTYTAAELQSITYDSYGWGEYHGNGTSLRDAVGDSYLRLYHTTLTIRNPFDCWIEFNSIVGPQGQDYIEANLTINGTAVGSNLKYINGKYYAFLPSGTNLITHPDDAVFGNPAIKKLSSSNTYSLTPTGTVLQGSVGPYTGFSSAYFNGSSYLSAPASSDFNLGGGQYTIEAWVYPTALNNYDCIIGKWGASAEEWNLYYENGQFRLIQSGYSYAYKAWTATNQWIHIAAVYDGTNTQIYVNGQSGTSFAGNGISNSTQVVTIGGYNRAGTWQYFDGYISNLRVTKGQALYTSNFTPSKTPVGLTANTALLANFDNAGIVDSTGKNVLQTVGNAQISTGTKKFGTGSMYFDGNGDYLSIPVNSSNDLGIGGEPYTVEQWVYFNSFPGSDVASVFSLCKGGGYAGWNSSTGHQYLLGFIYNNLLYTQNWNGSSLKTISVSNPFQLNTWYHYAVSYDGTTTRIYVNGTLVVSSANTYSTTSSPVRATIGVLPSLDSSYFNGYIDDLRVTKGVARYTSNFTVPAKALPAQGI